jgi:hypothetical protein
MNKKIQRLLLLAAATLLVSLALQTRAEAYAAPSCPPGYTGSMQSPAGCCLKLNPPSSTQAYEEYYCVNGTVVNPVRVCSTQACT